MAKLVCVDFDGVIHSYESGWEGAHVISDPPVPGAIEGLVALIKAGYQVRIFSARSSQKGGIEAMQKWLIEQYRKMPPRWRMNHKSPEWFIGEIGFPKSKPPAFVTIDDRAITFDGHWTRVLDTVDNFVPWNKKEA